MLRAIDHVFKTSSDIPIFPYNLIIQNNDIKGKQVYKTQD